VAHQLKPLLAEQMLDIPLVARKEIIEAKNIMALTKQDVAQVRSQKAGSDSLLGTSASRARCSFGPSILSRSAAAASCVCERVSDQWDPRAGEIGSGETCAIGREMRGVRAWPASVTTNLVRPELGGNVGRIQLELLGAIEQDLRVQRQ